MSKDTVEKKGEMDFLAHLGELRKRIIWSAVAILVGSIVCYSYSKEIFEILCEPYYKAFPKGILIGTKPAEAFVLKFQLSFISGFIISCPAVFYQLWLFIEPGLYKEEKLLAIPFVFITSLLFACGVLFCFYEVFPVAYSFFADEYESVGISANIKIDEHLAFVCRSLLVFGVIFEMPVLAFFLGRLGVVTSRMLWGGIRYAIVLIFVVAAVLTPPDVFSQLLMAGPLVALYFLSIGIVKLVEKRQSLEDTSGA